MRMGCGRLAAVIVSMVLGASSVAHAQATRTWVSGVGDDANPCSRTAPCKTFAGAISKTAASGEINVLDPGGFGAVTITKAITIDGTPWISGVLVSGTNGIVVAAGASDRVILRGLDIDGVNTGLSGIRFQTGGSLSVENCTIYGFTQYGIDVEPTAGAKVFVRNTIARANTLGGIYLAPSAGTISATVEGSHLDENGLGLKAKGGVLATVRNTSASGNAAEGFLADTSPVELNLHSVVAANNDTGVHATNNAIVRLTDATVTNNTTNGLLADGGGTVSPFSDSQIAGNPPASAAATCQIGSGNAAPACPEAAVCQAPVIQAKMGNCKRCRTKGGVTTCTNCPVTVQ